MRIAIVGSRNYTDADGVVEYVNSLPDDTIVITGGADGVDSIAEGAARKRGLEVIIYRPDWDTFGRAAGPIRNRKIVNDCDKLVAFWDGSSAGTKNSISLASKDGKLEKVFKDKNKNQGELF